MTEKEREKLFQSIMDDENLFSTVPEKDLGELIDDFIKSYKKIGRLAKRYNIYYDFSRKLKEADLDNNEYN